MTTKELNRKYYRQKLLEIVQDDYPECKEFHDYLVDVLEAMRHQPGDDYEIIVEDLKEPTTISVTIHPTYAT